MEALPRLNLLRCKTGDTGTFGVINYPDIKKHWFSGERPNRNNQAGLSCVNPKLYKCDWLWSDAHGRFVYHLMDVDGHSGIEMHYGSFCGDTEKINPKTGEKYKSDVTGCILVGNGQREIEGQWAIYDSRVATKDFEDTMKGQSFMLDIQEAYTA